MLTGQVAVEYKVCIICQQQQRRKDDEIGGSATLSSSTKKQQQCISNERLDVYLLRKCLLC
eukprot:scaffold6014_cov84-Skeletonema_menzelii.AAC.1